MPKNKRKKDPYAAREAQKYDNPIPSREFILELLNERGKPASQKEIELELHITSKEQKEALRRRLIAMMRDGQLLKNRKHAFGPLDSMELVAGIVIGHKEGFGFIEREDDQEDLFLTPRQMRAVFHGDRVLARVSNIDTRGRKEAMIVEVLERNTQQIVGRYYRESGISFVESANQRINQDIHIPLEDSHTAEHGQMVVVAITSQPTMHQRPIGRIIEVLGDHMAPGMEIKVAIKNHSLPIEWPEAALLEAQKFASAVTASAKENRLDLRHLPFVTIDGEDAKDFDDAVYCELRKQGGWTLIVAIADVSYYVKPQSALDNEAYQRGNSVYFPGRVIPMLPETLSNNLCSLMPNVDRLAMVCEMTIQPNGRISKYQFSEAIFQSQARLTYKQVHLAIEKKDKRVRQALIKQLPQLTELYALFHVLSKARKTRGAIDFDLPETKIVFDKKRKIKEIVAYERFDSHRVIEECMLAANISAAKFLQKHESPALYRVHQGPTEEKLKKLLQFLREMGLPMPAHREVVPSDYAHILRVIEDRPDAHMIQTLLLRSMSQAIYSPDNRGHFGLAYDAYAHFTSPIRRYPDLLVHRAIKQILKKSKNLLDPNFLMKAGDHCSMTERRADDATNEVTDWLKCEFMMNKIGKDYDGIISGVMNFGIFVELIEIYTEGLVHISALPADYYHFDAIKHTLLSEKSGRRFRIGDKIKIKVANVNLDKRQIDFVLAEGEFGQFSSERRKKSAIHKKIRKKPLVRTTKKSRKRV